jgi:ribosome-associated translation inhibitor RaiA
VQIIVHAHHAVISRRMQERAERALTRLAARLARPIDALVRFEQDGPIRRVELLLHASPGRRFVAEGYARTYGPALAEAAARLERQVSRGKRLPKSRGAEVPQT